ncbi:hypothetical protein QZH41_001339 [Actinostola sp. cb2023]|nr:hypothetical protein QZH41_001339 [Actinostola sp. cb2023]
MADLIANNKGKRRTRSSTSSTESTNSPDLKKAKNTSAADISEDDEVNSNMTEAVERKLDDILSKLSKLDTIEKSVNEIQTTMAKIEARTTKLEEFEASARNEMGDLKSAITFCDNSVTSLEVKLKEELETLKSENEVWAKEFEAKIEDLKSKDLYLEAYSRRENIKFMNINEEDDENAEKVIRSFLRDKLNYSDCDEVEIQRVHRNPARQSMNRATPRPILVRFLRAKDCEDIMSRGRNLKGTNYQMFFDLPSELDLALELFNQVISRYTNMAGNQFLRDFRDCLEIRGIPLHRDEDADDLAKKVGELIDVEIDDDDISISHRLQYDGKQPSSGSRAAPKYDPAIIVKFVRRNFRDEFYKARKHLRNKSTRDLGFTRILAIARFTYRKV